MFNIPFQGTHPEVVNDLPPSTFTICPVIFELLFEARNIITFAMSYGEAIFPNGMFSLTLDLKELYSLSLTPTYLWELVSTGQEVTALTLILLLDNSAAAYLVNISNPALLMQYPVSPD